MPLRNWPRLRPDRRVRDRHPHGRRLAPLRGSGRLRLVPDCACAGTPKSEFSKLTTFDTKAAYFSKMTPLNGAESINRFIKVKSGEPFFVAGRKISESLMRSRCHFLP